MRVALFFDLVYQEGPKNCTKLVSVLDKPIPKSTLSQHMRILREAGLIRGERHGVEMRNSSRYDEVNARYPGLLLGSSAHTRSRVRLRRSGVDAGASRTVPAR